MNIFDLDYIKNDHRFIAGVDEVGRGPLAGPVVAATTYLSLSSHTDISSFLLELRDIGVTDSKKLTAKKRIKILEALGVDVDGLVAGKKYFLREENSFSLSFSIAEKFIFSGGILSIYAVLARFMPLSFEGLTLVYLFYFFITASSHHNIETYPAYFNRIPILRYLCTASYHAFHRTYPQKNFGLYTRLFDKWFGTELSQYEMLYEKSASQKGLTQIGG